MEVVHGSQEKIRRYPNVTLIQSKKGRAIQMNVGAKAATEIPLFFTLWFTTSAF
jgi:hypothetical protein